MVARFAAYFWTRGYGERRLRMIDKARERSTACPSCQPASAVILVKGRSSRHFQQERVMRSMSERASKALAMRESSQEGSSFGRLDAAMPRCQNADTKRMRPGGGKPPGRVLLASRSCPWPRGPRPGWPPLSRWPCGCPRAARPSRSRCRSRTDAGVRGWARSTRSPRRSRTS